jgi:sterol 14-demethylase
MVVQLEQPCRVRYRRRAVRSAPVAKAAAAGAAQAAVASLRVRVDADLCQGHGVCAGEAPEVFRVDPATNRVELLVERPAAELRERVEKAVRFCPTRALSLRAD